jgi:cytochrome P450
MRRMFADPVPVLDELRATCGPVSGLGAGPMRFAFVGDAAAVRELLAMPSDRFRWGHKFNVLGFVVGDGSMIVSDGEDHRRRRSSVQAAFSRRRLNGWIPMIVDRTDAAIDRLVADASTDGDGDTVVDLYPVGRRLVLEIVVRALFGEGLAHRAAELGELFQRSQDYIAAPAFKQIPHPFPGTARARVKADRRALDAIIDAEMAHKRQAPSGDPLDVLEALVVDGSLSDSEIRDQVLTLIGAGFDTTAAALAWMLWCATLAPGVWGRLRAEADEVLGPVAGGGTLDHSTLAALRTADGVMRETLRLQPPGVVSPREAATDITLGEHTIRKGTLILWSAYLVGRDPEAWPDPLRFDPDRFRDLTPEQRKAANAAWVPFGGGTRNCIGFALAQMELTLIIARLAQRLDVDATAPEAPAPIGMVVNRPTGGAPMRVASRVRT